MPIGSLNFENISFSYGSMPTPLFAGLDLSFPRGWTGVVGANGAGKTTVLKLACGLLEPDEGLVRGPAVAVYCAQRTDDPPVELPEVLGSGDPRALRLRQRLALGPDWAGRWPTLSHGERKRAQIGCALWLDPDVLGLDEPTNHIDAECRAVLVAALRGYRGIGLLVSHDRGLLDALCGRCLFVEPPDAVMRPGGYSSGRKEADREELALRRRKDTIRDKAVKLEREAARRASRAAQVSRGLSKKGLDPKDHDRKGRIDLARLTGVDGKAARLAAGMKTRSEDGFREAAEIHVRKRYELGIWFEAEACRRDVLFKLPAGTVPFGDGRGLEHPELVMRPGDRIAVSGPNGTGKSTLIRLVLEALAVPADRLTYIPQEIGLETARGILEEVRRQPSDVLGRVLNIVSRLGSRPAGLLYTDEPSPGELRKLLLALGIARRPWLIIMDEPTNHLDLPSIECLEEALEGCPCGLLLVSHDERLLGRLTEIRWAVERCGMSGEERNVLRVGRVTIASGPGPEGIID